MKGLNSLTDIIKHSGGSFHVPELKTVGLFLVTAVPENTVEKITNR